LQRPYQINTIGNLKDISIELYLASISKQMEVMQLKKYIYKIKNMKYPTLLVAALATISITSCIEQTSQKAEEKQTPQQAAEAFSNAYETNDWETAKKNATAHGIDQLEIAESSLFNIFDDLVILGTNVNQTDRRIIENVNAEITYECTVTFTNKETAVYKLVQEGEFWKVDFELPKEEHILDKITDMVDKSYGDEINAAIDNVIDKGINMAKDSLLNAIGF